MEQKTVRYRVLDPRAKAPVYATPGAAAADLCAVLDAPLTLSPGERTMIPTGLAIELPDAGCVALLYARSGLAVKHGLTLPNCVGVIDSDYRGEIKVALINLGQEPTPLNPENAWPSFVSHRFGRRPLCRRWIFRIRCVAQAGSVPPARFDFAAVFAISPSFAMPQRYNPV